MNREDTMETDEETDKTEKESGELDKINSVIKYLNYEGRLFIRIRTDNSNNEEETKSRGKK